MTKASPKAKIAVIEHMINSDVELQKGFEKAVRSTHEEIYPHIPYFDIFDPANEALVDRVRNGSIEDGLDTVSAIMPTEVCRNAVLVEVGLEAKRQPEKPFRDVAATVLGL